MSSAEIDHRIVSFLSAFARRQAAGTTDFPGGFAVRDDAYARSHEHNQLVVEGETDPSLLAAFQRPQITVLSEAVGEDCAPALAAAGYDHRVHVVMVHQGPRPAPAARAVRVTVDDLRTPLTGRMRGWMPDADEETLRHLVDRRAARLRGAPEVHFLAARDEAGAVAAWGDLYYDRVSGLAQLEDLVTAETHLRQGHATTVLATALHHAADAELFFLVADPADWPQHWYARRGFVPAGRMHVFTRT
ncbi:GNAT family N-acetyltransferase [Streptacidiphilus pinicola]|uniref:GNAT family N-acetyltransferase n=1 Tax=Streptacidiphilus pinicola TaxID=2219663 RepID=A0A2X0IBW0_9ACTN|nr:GNAT family N-acetyltransferase [Streptacidiphilus pinicola]RAG81997.1 GNAT family N-acetyltransferase [Streptacidiphilus pinicola]